MSSPATQLPQSLRKELATTSKKKAGPRQQVSLKLEPELTAVIERVADEHGWTRTHTVRVAVYALAELLDQHGR